MRWTLALPAVLLSALPALAEPVLRVTVDGPEYCELLAQRLAAAPAAAAELPRALGDEGMRLCASGHVRTGIAKLRRAIRAAQQSQASAAR